MIVIIKSSCKRPKTFFFAIMCLFTVLVSCHTNTSQNSEEKASVTIASIALKQLITKLDTIQKWVQNRPFYGTSGNVFGYGETFDSIQKAFDNSTKKIDSLFIEVLSDSLSYHLNLNKYFKTVVSPDSMVKVIEYGDANISGTGRFKQTIIQIRDRHNPIAFPWENYSYDLIDTLLIEGKVHYVFPYRYRYSTWLGAFELKVYTLDSILKPVESELFAGNNRLFLTFDHSWKDADGYEHAYDLAEENIYYDALKKEIRINHPTVITDQSPFKELILNNGGRMRYSDAAGKLNITLGFNKEVSKFVLDPPSAKIFNNLVERYLVYNLPEDWVARDGILIDTLLNIKTGEMLPGLLSPLDSTLTGAKFLSLMLNKGSITSKEGEFTFQGMPYKTVVRDSIKYGQNMWYYGVADYGIDENIFRYQYTYFSVFGEQMVILSFYHNTLNENDQYIHKVVLKDMKVLKK